jgi:hypothetical protein
MSGDLESNLRPSKRRFGMLKVGRLTSLGQQPTRSVFGRVGSLDVDFFGSFRGVGKDKDAIVSDFQESAANRQIELVGSDPRLESTRIKGRDQCRMVR